MTDMTDEQREEAILEARTKLVRACTSQERRKHWETMRDLVLGRSPEVVRRMEIEKGLRSG